MVSPRRFGEALECCGLTQLWYSFDGLARKGMPKLRQAAALQISD
jgi:hypothetical protein